MTTGGAALILADELFELWLFIPEDEAVIVERLEEEAAAASSGEV
jgi:hypothetical protein